MNASLIVRGAPQYYECRPNILKELESLLVKRKKSRVLIIHGKKSLTAVQPFFPSFQKLEREYIEYNGECSLKEIERVSTYYRQGKFDSVIGIGGGKVLDLAKTVSKEVRGSSILIPTLASTCSAWTPLSVIYDDAGKFLYYEIFPQSADVVLIEPEIILSSPSRYLRAGIADTIAKWYEADVVIRSVTEPPVPVMIAHHSARLCKDILLEKSVASLEDMDSQQLSKDFIKVIETNIMLGGMVGGYGDDYGRIAGAHAIHNALTEFPSTHHLLHGEKVAYGILVQLAIEKQWEEIEELIPFYKKLDLPMTLKDVGIYGQDEINDLAKYAIQNDSLQLVDSAISEDRVRNAIGKLESKVSVLV
jgi:hydroxycarboxylate dehydrogenase A